MTIMCVISNKNIATTVTISILALSIAAAIFYSPRFLAWADKPVKSDAVILFVGEDTSAREREARQLIREGFARYLIIPGLDEVFGPFSDKYQQAGNEHAAEKKRVLNFRLYPGYYEKTHIEELHAQQMMNAMGLKSAIMVSSPYHMKRIRMISSETFGAQVHHLTFVPTRYEHAITDFADVKLRDLKMVALEFPKIGWFLIYSLFL